MQGKQQDFRAEKYIRYGIRKYSFGAASVAIAAGLMFLGNGVVSATEVQSAETAITTSASSQGDKETEKAEPKAETVETAKPETVNTETVNPETEKATEVKPEVKVEDTKKVNKAILEASIATLESKLSTAKYADATVVNSAKEVLATAKATLAKGDASQADVDAQAETVSALSTVVTESNTAGFDKKQASEEEVAKAEAEKKATPAEKDLSVAKTTLTQVSSEAEVTNKLAETELAKADVKEENKAAVTEAVAKNKEVIAKTKTLLADKSVTKEQVDAQLERLNESILAVYNELKNAGIGRDGKFSVNLADAQTTALKDASTETGKKWLEDHGYSSLSDIKVKTKEDNLKEIKDLNDQIQWLDFGDTNAWTGLNANNQLQIGSTYTKELIPGYIVTMKVKELKPFESTEIFKNRVAGTDLESSYQPDKENKFNPENGATGLGANPQNQWTHVANSGLTTGNAKTTIAGTNPAGQPKNGQAAGVKFEVTATYNGKAVKPGIVMTSGEDVGPLESEIYTTDGTPWDLAAIVGYKTNKNAYRPLDQFKDMNGGKTAVLKWQDEKFYNALSGGKFATPDAATAGLGSQVFGGALNQNGSGTAILSTANVTEVGLYIMSSGQQSSMIGIKFSDFGDLPESYGMAEHYLRTQSIDYDTKAIKQIQQPYLGKVKADIDSAPGTRVVGVDSDDAKDNADEGVDQLIAPDNFKQNKDTGLPEVQLVKAPDNTYKVKVIASANGNDKYTDTVAPAYVRGFIDFNGNGKFDKGEESNIATVTGNGQEVELTFTNTQVIDTSKDVVNFRVRIAKDEEQVEKATGIAYSGEVEDNQIRVSHPPRGDYEETTGKQGEKQNIGIEFVNRVEADASELGSNNGKTTFNAYGKIDYTEQRNSISLASTKKVQTEGVMIVKPDGTLAKTYTKEGQGTYEVTDTGVTFTPEANFVGKADGIVLRAVDANGQSTGWTSLTDQHGLVNINDGTHTTTTKTMDAVYVPNVTPKEITADPETSTDVQGKAQKKTPTFKTDAGTDNAATVTPSATYPAKLVDPKTGAKVDSVTVDGEGTYTINPTTGEVTFQPLPTFKGTATGVDVTLTAPVGQNKDGQDVTATATTKYTPTVTAVEPTAKPADSAGVQGETQKGTPTFTAGNAEVPIKENSVKLLNPDGTEANGPVDALDEKGNKVGEYTVNPATGEVTFTPTDKTYTGKVTPAKVQAEDKNGTKVNTTYTPHIVGVTPTATPAESSGIQGEVQDGTVTFAPGETTVEGVKKSVPIKANSAVLLDASGNPVVPGTPVDALDPEGNKVGEYTIDPATNKVTFTPTNKAYKGKVQPVNVQAEDENGTKVSTTYTPTIVGVTPTADPAKSVDVQGATQTGKPVFQGGTAMVNGEEKIVEIDEDKPAKLVDPKTGEQVDSVTVEGEGTYTVAPDGTVTFKPEPQFTGVAKGVEVVRQDKNGTPVKASYTPEVKPVTPTGTDTVTEDIQGSTQTGKPEFKGGTVTIDGKEKTVEINEDKPAKLVDPKTGDPVDSVTIEGEGTYTVAPDGTVTFTPEKNFTGKGTGVTVQREDKNGTPVTAKYTPVVKKATPTGTDAVTEDIQGSTQTGKPTFEGGKVTVNGEEKTVEINEDKPAKLVDPKTGDPVDSVTIEGEGTYTVAPDGTVTFTPEKNFTGKGTGVTVQREDKNGTPVKATYTPVVKPATPTSSDVITTNVQGATQSGTPTFEGGKVTVNGEEKTVEIDETVKPTFDDGTTEKQVPGEGTYTIDENGTVTFTPEKTFTGQATGVTVKRVDKNGTPITAKYTPVVVPVTPTSKDSESEGPKGQPQSGTPTFEGGKVTINGKEVPVEIDETVKPTFDDGTTEKKVPGEGTYTIDENGKVTFTPEPDFVGKASGVTVKRIDKNGTPVTATYTPTVRPDTSFVDKDGNPLSPTEDGTKPTKDIPGYKIIKTEVDEKGNTKHIYEKVTTTHKDKDGNVIPGTTTEEGTTPKKDIPGYRFVETKKLPNGDIEHVYEKVKTSHKDKDGNEIPNYPTEDGEQPKKDIPGYRFVETKKLPNGDIEHVYEKVKTSHKDKDGNEIPNYPTEDGEQPKKDIPGYRFVETKKLPNGDVEHVYEKVKTSHKDKDGNEIPNYPTEDGEQPKKDIPGYRFVETKKLPNGDVEHVYEKVKTSHKDKDGNEIPNYPTEDGEQPKKDIPGYRFVETKKLPNGDVEHVYEKVKTSHKDKDGNEIPNYPTEDGEQPKKDIPGYRFVETKTLPNGDTEHVYEKVKTSHKDKDGNEIPNYPTEDGEQPKKDIPGYRFVETKTLPNGDIEHVYEKVKTSHKDKDGNEIPNYPTEDGEQPKKDIPGYRFVETKTLPNGDIEHVYEKVKTSHKDKDGNEIPNYPTEDGEQPKKDIPGYRFVETKKLPNGDIEHVYEKVSTPAPTPSPVPQPTPGKQNTTTWTDENGNPLKPTESGSKEPGTVSGYEYVKTVTDPNGNIKHIFKKVEMPTPRPVEPSQPATPKYVEGQKELPNTGTEDNANLAALGLLGVLSGFGLVARKKKED
ncbi:Ig-like domain-containing protein [Streptococcus vestibularis]|uniref:Ig-like domain-containing protein n=7 Tax=Streptococcus vestibularis TaxID=1343 RepID=UPI000F712311|nr:GEVED domain-containing protein [Streptococcus vestibularis]VED87227.1 surface-associated protein CshB [Streptococcus vestibularis]